MKRLLLFAITAGLLSPIAAKADDLVRETCGRVKAGFISPKEAHKKLGLPEKMYDFFQTESKNFSERDFINQKIVIDDYCQGYTGIYHMSHP